MIHADETCEPLQLRDLTILQKKQGFRFGMDAVLLADFARIDHRARVADFGTGTGILPLLLYGRDKGASFDGLELQPDMADMAARTMRRNGLDHIIRIHAASVTDAEALLGRASVDTVVCNPPYSMPNAATLPATQALQISRHQAQDGLTAWLDSAYAILRRRGRFCMVYPAAQMLAAMQALTAARLTPKRFRLVYPTAEKAARLVLIEAIRDAHPLLTPEPPLILADDDGNPSSEMRRIYHQITKSH